MPRPVYTVNCNVAGHVTVLSRHRTLEASQRRFRNLSRLLSEACRNVADDVRVWIADPVGKILQDHICIYTDVALLMSDPPDQQKIEVAKETKKDTDELHVVWTDEWKEQANKVFARMAEIKLHTIEISYSGYGDSGESYSIYGYFKPDSSDDSKDEHELAAIDHELDVWVQDIADNLLIPAGYENNDGGQGTVRFDWPSREIYISHEDNYIESQTSEGSWTL